MTTKNQRHTTIGLTVAIAMAVLGLAFWLDLTPQVDPDFFFAQNDPQIQESNAIERDFPSSSQVLVRFGGDDIEDSTYRSRLAELSTALSGLDNVTSVRNILTTPDFRQPLWRPLLVSETGDASYILLGVTPSNPSRLVDQINETVTSHEHPDFTIQVSGVPYVLELIRRSLTRDLVVFSLAAFAIFGIAVIAVYRRLWIAIGTLVTAVTTAVTTLTILQLAGIAMGLLTANLVTIVFVLTLSHVVFLTSNWRLETTSPAAGDTVQRAVRRTLLPSFWCMATTALGFVSLLAASAKPLRQLGIAGTIGTLSAITVAYVVYPFFLRVTAPYAKTPFRPARWLPATHRPLWLGGLGLIVLLFGFGVPRLSTDPSLLTYFTEESEIREGLEVIDQDGGSSPLRLVVDRGNNDWFQERGGVTLLRRLHDRLAEDPDVGSVVSPSILLSEIQRSPLARDRTPQEVMEIPILASVVAPFFSADKTQAHFLLRMREHDRTDTRHNVIERIRQTLTSFGVEPVRVGGLYDMQAKLSDLLGSSLRYTLTGLIILFGGIGWLLTRSVRTAALLALCLTAVPIVILGGFGHAGVAVDIISSPSANVALAMGVDSMIHLVVRTRRLTAEQHPSPWRVAREQLSQPILGATLIISAGFGIFGLSVFPPTARFGLAVILGTVAAATMALVAMPMLAADKKGI